MREAVFVFFEMLAFLSCAIEKTEYFAGFAIYVLVGHWWCAVCVV